jgi:hypothetical protein
MPALLGAVKAIFYRHFVSAAVTTSHANIRSRTGVTDPQTCRRCREPAVLPVKVYLLIKGPTFDLQRTFRPHRWTGPN